MRQLRKPACGSQSIQLYTLFAQPFGDSVGKAAQRLDDFLICTRLFMHMMAQLVVPVANP